MCCGEIEVAGVAVFAGAVAVGVAACPERIQGVDRLTCSAALLVDTSDSWEGEDQGAACWEVEKGATGAAVAGMVVEKGAD